MTGLQPGGADPTTEPDQRFHRGDRVRGRRSGLTGTVTGPAPRGPRGEPAVNIDWDGDAGGPAYEHDLGSER